MDGCRKAEQVRSGEENTLLRRDLAVEEFGNVQLTLNMKLNYAFHLLFQIDPAAGSNSSAGFIWS